MKSIFPNLISALPTPFEKGAENLDIPALIRLIEFQIAQGITGFVLFGTTGEAPVLEKEERQSILKEILPLFKDKASFFIGVGTNCTKSTIERAIEAEKSGADGLMLVVPYYNRPTQEGIISHFRAIHEVTTLPLMLYNIPHRTGVNLEPASLRILADLERVVALKDSSPSFQQFEQMVKIGEEIEKPFYVYAGDDALALPAMASGAYGVVSVASNLFPLEMRSLVEECARGDFIQAQKLHGFLQPLFQNLFIESNPAPLKYLLSIATLCEPDCRLPLVPLHSMSKERLDLVYEKMRQYALMAERA